MKTKVELVPATTRKRKGSVAAKVKQLDWVMQFIVRTQPCAVCNGSLSDGYNPRYPGKSITLHHTDGSREVDDWTNGAYVAGMVLCHKNCHRSYHLKKRHAENGKNVDAAALATMEKNIAKAVRRQRKLVSEIG
jgi:hypothetical protein